MQYRQLNKNQFLLLPLLKISCWRDENLNFTATNALLATSLVNLVTSGGRLITMRAFIDQGYKRSFKAEAAAQLLRVKRITFQASFVGIGGQASAVIKSVFTVTLNYIRDQQSVVVDC